MDPAVMAGAKMLASMISRALNLDDPDDAARYADELSEMICGDGFRDANEYMKAWLENPSDEAAVMCDAWEAELSMRRLQRG